MSNIRDSRNARLLNRAFAKLAKIGKHPSFAGVLSMLKKILGRDKAGSMVDPARFIDGASFPLDEFNKNLEDIGFELELLFDEHTHRAARVVEQQTILEEQTAEIRRQLLKVRENVERELLLAGSNFLDAIVIRFVDRTKIDSDQTTAEVDTASGIVTLPTAAGSHRVIPPVRPTTPIELESQDDDLVVLPGSSFASLFSDTLVGWHVKTMGNWLRVRFALGGPTKLSRINIKTPDDQNLVELRVSNDGLNYLRIQQPKTVVGGEVNYLFESQDISFIELYLINSNPPQTDGYVFSLDSIAIYTLGYQVEAQLVTTTLTTESDDNIKSVLVEVDADIPPATNLKVFVQGDNSPFTEVENKILDFTASQVGSAQFRATIANTERYSYSTVNYSDASFVPGQPDTPDLTGSPSAAIGMNDVWGAAESTFFGAISVPSFIDQKSLKLYRTNCWGVESRTSQVTKPMTNNLSMDLGERRFLYIPIEEVLVYGDAAGATIDVSRTITSGNNISVAGSPDAQVINITGTFNHAAYEPAALGPFAAETVTLVVVDNGEDRYIESVDQAGDLPSWFEDYDYLFIEGIGPAKVRSFDPVTFKLVFEPTIEIVSGADYIIKAGSRDLTRFVTSCSSKTITLSVDVREFEKLVVRYNTPIDGVRTTLVSPSVQVRSGRDSGVIGVSDKDYRIIGGQLELMSSSSLPMDGAGTTDSEKQRVAIEVSFEYVSLDPTEISYWTYAIVPPGVAKVLDIVPMTLDHNERVVWTDPTGKSIDMVGLPQLTLMPGIHRFSVVGQRAINDVGLVDTSSALYRLISLETVGGGQIFAPASGYIKELTGYLDPLVPTSRFFLERVARQDNTTHFAWEDGAILSVMRLDKPRDAITLEPGNDTTVEASDYILDYRYFSDVGISELKVKLVLTRDSGEDVSKTPVVRGLTIRFTE